MQKPVKSEDVDKQVKEEIKRQLKKDMDEKLKENIAEHIKDKIEREIEEELKSLGRLAKVIFALYNRLCELEISGAENTEKYQRELKGLISIIKTEKDCYADLISRMYLVRMIRDYTSLILCNRMPRDIFNFEGNISYDDQNYIIGRVYFQLSALCINSGLYSDVNKKDNHEKNDLINIYIDIDSSSKYLIILQENLDCNLLATREKMKIYYVDNCIKILRKSKYRISYSNPHIEGSILKSKFQISPSTFQNSAQEGIISNFSDEDSYNTNKRPLLISHIKELIQAMLSISDSKLINIASVVDLIVMQYDLRSYMLMLDDSDIADLKSYFDNVNILNIRNTNSNSSKNMINDAFENATKDKDKYLNNDQKTR